MGLTLFPGDGDTSSPDVGRSYGGFAAFRRQPARAARTTSNFSSSDVHEAGAGLTPPQ